MNNNADKYKNTFSQIRPSDETIERIFDITKNKKAARIPLYKKAIAAALTLIIAGGGIGGYFAVQNNNSAGNNNFTIVAYADDGSNITLSDKDIKLAFCKLTKRYEKESDSMMLDSAYTSFEIQGDDIAEAIFESEYYGLNIHDEDMRENHYDRDDYFVVKIPLTDKELADFESITEFDTDDLTEKAFIKKIMKKRDLSSYFGDYSMNIDDYRVYYSHPNDPDDEAYFSLARKEDYEDVTREGNKITEKNYDEDDKINDVSLDTWKATEYIHENPDAKLSELPKDKITITVKFKSGKTETKHMLVEFDDLGFLHCSIAD